MATLLVSYDTNTPGKDYDQLEEKLKTYPNWWHFLQRTWIVEARLTPEQLVDHLKPLFGPEDELLVVDISTGPLAWTGFNAEASAWLTANT